MTDITSVCLLVKSFKKNQLLWQVVPVLACQTELPFTIGTNCGTNDEPPICMLKYETLSSHSGDSGV